MSQLSRIMSAIEAGSRVRIRVDYYGQEVVEIKRRWLPISRHLRLPHDELAQVKTALGRRDQRRRAR